MNKFIFGALISSCLVFSSYTKPYVTEASLRIESTQSAVKKAQFPGGPEEYDNWLIQNFYTPEGAKRYGAVIVEFTVLKNGKCKDFTVIKAIDEELDFAAVEILKAMPKWEPATKDGDAVDSKARVPVRFIRQE